MATRKEYFESLVKRTEFKKPMSAYQAMEIMYPEPTLMVCAKKKWGIEHPVVIAVGYAMFNCEPDSGLKFHEFEKMAEGNPSGLARSLGAAVKVNIMDPEFGVVAEGVFLEQSAKNEWILLHDKA